MNCNCNILQFEAISHKVIGYIILNLLVVGLIIVRFSFFGNYIKICFFFSCMRELIQAAEFLPSGTGQMVNYMVVGLHIEHDGIRPPQTQHPPREPYQGQTPSR